MNKLISFSLFGHDLKYQSGALRNAILARSLYSDWICRFYVSSEIPLPVIQKLKNEQADIIRMIPKAEFDGLFWRFLPVSEERWDVVIVRNADSPISEREVQAVDEWLVSNKKFHIMRDHPSHTVPILGGMWGAKRGMIRNMALHIMRWEKHQGTKAYDKMDRDQVFLVREIYPMVRYDALIHSDLVRYNDEVLTPFPSPREGGQFVGQFFTDGEKICAKENTDLFDRARLTSYRIRTPFSLHSLTKRLKNLPQKLSRFEKQSILLFHDFFSSYPESKYRFIHDKELFMASKCVVFHIPSLTRRDARLLSVLRAIKPKSQVWAAYSLESAENYPLLDNPSFMKLFDIEISYRKTADIWSPYFRQQLPLLQKTTLKPKTGFCAAFVSSPFNQSKRLQVLWELMRYIRVDSYGSVFQTHKLKEDRGYTTKQGIISQYKFTIAFENSIGVDYVTEKLYQPLIAGSIPVYLGAPNVDEYSPGDNAYLNISDFKSVRELAEFMKSADLDAFHEWRNRPIREKFIRYSELTEKEPFDRLCDLIFNTTRPS
ncbi:MAG: glycosyltransferase family 10 [Desulfoferrobacter sp.]